MSTQDEYIKDARFHRVFELPANPASGREENFKVQYADFGYRNEADPNQENVLLFFGPLMASRLLHVAKDGFAKQHKIRIINPDRPGIGGTDPVDMKERLGIWREAIPALLAHLGIQHVFVACHSGGTVWALDMTLHHPELLHPSKAYIAIGAPWILPAHTGLTIMSLVNIFPATLVNQTDKFVRLVNNHIGPMIGTSMGFTANAIAKLVPSPSSQGEGQVPEGSEEVKLEETLWPKIMNQVYEDGVEGISSEALLLMQKTGNTGGWSDWGDYDMLIPRLADLFRAQGRKLKVDIFYAEKDTLIGDGGSKGPLWFDKCWQADGLRDAITFQSETVKGADHDGIWTFKQGTIQALFERIVALSNI
ncbi:hypothetical protein OQA88_2702 [Cercophora sp. LCS_1]